MSEAPDKPTTTQRGEADAGGAGLKRWLVLPCKNCDDGPEIREATPKRIAEAEYPRLMYDASDVDALLAAKDAENESLHGECLLKDRVIGTKDERIAELETRVGLRVAMCNHLHAECDRITAELGPLAELGRMLMRKAEEVASLVPFASAELICAEVATEMVKNYRAAQPKQDEEDAK